MSMTRTVDVDGALQVSAAIQKRLQRALTAALFDDREVAALLSRAPALTSFAIANLWITHAAALILDDPTQLPRLLDRIDQVRAQAVAIGTAGRATTEILQ